VPVLSANEPVVDPAVTVTVTGAVNPVNPLKLRLTAVPPAGAAFESVAVQLLLAFDPSVVGLHCSDEITVGATRLMFAACDVLLYDAVTVPLWSELTAPVLTVNEPVVDSVPTVSVAGTVNPVNPLAPRLMTAPPAGAAFESVRVQLLLALDPSVAGLHCSDEITVGATRLMFADCDVLL
jgi:hypothetical protein